jgi:hypothetical protein
LPVIAARRRIPGVCAVPASRSSARMWCTLVRGAPLCSGEPTVDRSGWNASFPLLATGRSRGSGAALPIGRPHSLGVASDPIPGVVR